MRTTPDIWPAVMPNYVDHNKRMNQHAYSASMNSKPIYDEYDPWATNDPSPLYVRRTPKRVRNRKPTLASVIRQARKAGIDVTGATVTKDGVSLDLGKRGETIDMNDCTIATAEELLRLI
jgi:hypothetical protein